MNEFLLALPGIIGLLATVIKIIADWRKGKAEATDLLVESATGVVALLRAELLDARTEIVTLEAELATVRGRVRRLERQVRDLGAVPVNDK